MENENNNSSAPRPPVQQPPSMSVPSTNTLEVSPQPQIPPQGSEQKKSGTLKTIILTVVITVISALVILMAIGIVSEMQEDKPNNDQEQSIAEPQDQEKAVAADLPIIENEILKQVDENLAERRVTDGRFDGQITAYMTFDEDNNFHSIQDAEPIRYYDLGEFDTSSEKCVSEIGIEILSDSGKIFVDAGYSVVQSGVYAGGFGCIITAMASNELESCSVTLSTPSDESKKNAFNFVISTYCEDEEELEAEKAEYRDFYDIVIDTTEGFVPEENRQLRYIRGYVKDSKTDGYRIASDESAPVFNSFYLKKDDAKWIEITDEGEYFVACNPSGENAPDILAAFAGEPCGPNGNGTVGS